MLIDIRKPYIQAPTLEGRMEEVRSYLFGLSEQLNWILNQSEQSQAAEPGNAGAGPRQIYRNIQELIDRDYVNKPSFEQYKTEIAGILLGYKDTVTEISTQTVDGVLYYIRKWDSGDMECWGKRNAADLSASTVQIKLPQGFKALNTWSVSCESPEQDLLAIGVAADSKKLKVKVRSWDGNTPGTAPLRISARGRWK